MDNNDTLKTSYKTVVTGHGYKDLDIEKEILKEIGADVIDADQEKEKLEILVKDVDALLVGDTTIDKKIIDIMDKCKVISEYGIGVDNIDLAEATNRKIAVLNVPGYGTGEVADQALALMLALARKIVKLNNLTRSNGWSSARNNAKPIHRLKGKIVGIIGFGRIGHAFAERVKPLGCKILIYDPYKDLNDFKNIYYISDIEEILKESDFISLHCPLTDETKNLLNENSLKLMKRNAYIINVARGAIINEEALLKALENNWIAGAGLDVLSDYDLKSTNALYNYFMNNDNLIIVPHTAWYSEESKFELRMRATKGIVDVLKGNKPESQVNKY